MTKVYSNISGTTSPSFKIGKGGVTIYQGDTLPSDSFGNDGDIFVRSGAAPAIFQRTGATWVRTSANENAYVAQDVPNGSSIDVTEGVTLVNILEAMSDPDPTSVRLYVGLNGQQVTVVAPQDAGIAQVAILAPIGETFDNFGTVYITNPRGTIRFLRANDKWIIVGRA